MSHFIFGTAKNLALIIAIVLVATAATKTADAKDKNSSQHNLQIKVQEVAFIDLETTGADFDIMLNPSTPTEAGLGVDFSKASNSELWLNYSSIVKKNKTRSISASINGNLPDGTTLTVQATEPAGNGEGDLGTVNPTAQPLTDKEAVIVSDIGSCYTGDGNSSGCNLTYKLDLGEDSYAGLMTGNYSVQVTYTISEK